MAATYQASELKQIGEQSRGRLPPASAVQGMFLYEMQRDTEDEKLFDAAMFRLSRAETVSDARKERLDKLEKRLQATEHKHQIELADAKYRITRLEGIVRVLTMQKSPMESPKATVRLPVSSLNGQALDMSLPKVSPLMPLEEKRPESHVPVDLRKPPTSNAAAQNSAAPVEPNSAKSVTAPPSQWSSVAATPTSTTITAQTTTGPTKHVIPLPPKAVMKQEKIEPESSQRSTTSFAIDQWGGTVGQLVDQKSLPPIPAVKPFKEASLDNPIPQRPQQTDEVSQWAASESSVNNTLSNTMARQTITANTVGTPKSKMVKWTEPPIQLGDSQPKAVTCSASSQSSSAAAPAATHTLPQLLHSEPEFEPPTQNAQLMKSHIDTYIAEPKRAPTVLHQNQAIPRTKEPSPAAPPPVSTASTTLGTYEPFKFSTKRPAVKIVSTPTLAAPSTVYPAVMNLAAALPVKPAPTAASTIARTSTTVKSRPKPSVGVIGKNCKSLNVNAPAFAPAPSMQMPPQATMSMMTPAMQALFMSKMAAGNGAQ